LKTPKTPGLFTSVEREVPKMGVGDSIEDKEYVVSRRNVCLLYIIYK